MLFQSLSLLLIAVLAAVEATSTDSALRGSERALTWSVGCAYQCPANSKFQMSWRRSLTWTTAPQCTYPQHRQLTWFSWWPETTCPCDFDDCVCSTGLVKLNGACTYPAKPVPMPVAKPYPMPVAKPTPVPVAKPTPMPVVVAKPVPMPAKPYPMPVAKPTPVPVAKPTPMPVVVVKPVPMPVPKPYPMPVDKPAFAPTLPICQLEAIGGCGSCECPLGTHRGDHVQCLDTLNDCFCDETNTNADRHPDCIRN